MKSIKISLKLETSKDADVITKSLSPEIKKPIPNTKVEMNVQKNNVTLIIKSNQINTLRAASNSFMRWIQTALSVSNVI
jgi:tRNA threonylcarbamoyladenosine modification (KEOPS) complex  Pcc1 subunit